MRTLFAEQYAPITSRIGFLEHPFADTVELFAAWHRGLNHDVHVTDVSGDGFPYAFHRLEPLRLPSRTKWLLVQAGKWTAYFDNGVLGTDPFSPIGYLAKVAQVRGLMITTVPDVPGRRLGGIQWELVADHPTAWLNFERQISVINESGRWRWDRFGDPLPFEQVERYRARRIRDRFDSHLVEAYSQAIGLDVFAPATYGSGIALIEDRRPPRRDVQVIERSLLDLQAELGIEPGRADHLRG
jgi:hypothetical protein